MIDSKQHTDANEPHWTSNPIIPEPSAVLAAPDAPEQFRKRTEGNAPRRYKFSAEDRRAAVAARAAKRRAATSARAQLSTELRAEMLAALGHEPTGLEKPIFDSVLLVLMAIRCHVELDTDSVASQRRLSALLRRARTTLQAASQAIRQLRDISEDGFSRPLSERERRETARKALLGEGAGE